MRSFILKFYQWAQHPAHASERPVHAAYFATVAWNSHGSYGYIAMICCVIMVLTIREPS